MAQCFADPGTSVVYSQYGFAVFAIATAAAGAQALCVPALPRDHAQAPLGHDLEAMAAAVRGDTRLVYLANPNNPTGTWFGVAELAAFLARVPETTLVVADEAYGEYLDAPGTASAGEAGIDQGAVVRSVAGGLHDDVAGKAQVVAQGKKLGCAGIAGRVFALGRKGKLAAGAEDVAVRVHRAGGQLELRLAGVGVPVQPAGGFFKCAHGKHP